MQSCRRIVGLGLAFCLAVPFCVRGAESKAPPSVTPGVVRPAASEAVSLPVVAAESAGNVDVQRKADIEAQLKDLEQKIGDIGKQEMDLQAEIRTQYKTMLDFSSNTATQDAEVVKIREQISLHEAEIRKLQEEVTARMEKMAGYKTPLGRTKEVAVKIGSLREQKRQYQIQQAKIGYELRRINEALDREAREKAEKEARDKAGGETKDNDKTGQPAPAGDARKAPAK